VEDQIVHAKVITQLTDIISQLPGQRSFSLRLGENSIIAGKMTEQVVMMLAQTMRFELDINDVNAEIQRIR